MCWVNTVVRMATLNDSTEISSLLSELGYKLPMAQVLNGLEMTDTTVLVAVEESIDGFVAFNTRWHFQRGAKVTSIDSLVVSERKRGMGVGALLVDATARIARQEVAIAIELNSGTERTATRRFYERLGFTVVSNHFRLDLPTTAGNLA
jgi:N-acetylglutamate synthase-like GNAT family acetyltransferase